MSESLVTALTLPIWTYVMHNVPLFLEREKLFRKNALCPISNPCVENLSR